MKSLMSDNQIYTFHRMCERYAQLFNQRVALESQVDIYNKRYHAALKDLGEVKTSLGKCRESTKNFGARFMLELILKKSKTMIKIDAPLEPVPFKRVMQSGKRRYNNPRYSKFKDELGFFALKAMAGREPFKYGVRITMRVYRDFNPTTLRYGDLDNHLKAVMDALNGICYEDDRQVFEAHVSLHRGEPHLEIFITELKGEWQD